MIIPPPLPPFPPIEFDCSDFNLNGLFDAFDGFLYDVFIAETLKGSQPQTVQQLLDIYNAKVIAESVPPPEPNIPVVCCLFQLPGT